MGKGTQNTVPIDLSHGWLNRVISHLPTSLVLSAPPVPTGGSWIGRLSPEDKAQPMSPEKCQCRASWEPPPQDLLIGLSESKAHTHAYTRVCACRPNMQDSLNGEISLVLLFLFFLFPNIFPPKMEMAWLCQSWHIQDSDQREPSPTPTPHLFCAGTYTKLCRRQVYIHVIQKDLCSVWAKYQGNAKQKWLNLHSLV